MLRKPSLSLKKVVKSKRLMKAIKGHQRPQSKKSEKSQFINHCLIYAQEAFHWHENSGKAQKTDKGHQRNNCWQIKRDFMSLVSLLNISRKNCKIIDNKARCLVCQIRHLIVTSVLLFVASSNLL